MFCFLPSRGNHSWTYLPPPPFCLCIFMFSSLLSLEIVQISSLLLHIVLCRHAWDRRECFLRMSLLIPLSRGWIMSMPEMNWSSIALAVHESKALCSSINCNDWIRWVGTPHLHTDNQNINSGDLKKDNLVPKGMCIWYFRAIEVENTCLYVVTHTQHTHAHDSEMNQVFWTNFELGTSRLAVYMCILQSTVMCTWNTDLSPNWYSSWIRIPSRKTLKKRICLHFLA